MDVIEIEYNTATPEGIRYHYTARQTAAMREMEALWMDIAVERGYREGDATDRLPPEVAEPYSRSLLADAQIVQDETARVIYAAGLRTARFECRAPRRLDRLTVALTQQNQGFHAAVEAAHDLLAPRLTDGWEGAPSPGLLICLKWECFILIMGQGEPPVMPGDAGASLPS